MGGGGGVNFSRDNDFPRIIFYWGLSWKSCFFALQAFKVVHYIFPLHLKREKKVILLHSETLNLLKIDL